MKCPFCGFDDTQVKDSRPAEDSAAIRRRRACTECGARFTTFEREKLARSIRVALRKRPVDEDRIEKLVNSIQRRLETEGESDIPSNKIGEIVMETLKELDQVAYVRFASVYRNFGEAKDFQAFLGELGRKE